MDKFITWSGWIFTIIGAAISIYQLLKQKKEIDLLKIQITEQKNQILNYGKQINTGTENYLATNKGVSMKNNNGIIDIR